jgi:hypothetical protein
MTKVLCDHCRNRPGRPWGPRKMLCDQCIDRRTYRLTSDQLAVRYPRLIRALKWAAILSDGEAASAIRDYRDGFGAPGFGCEAVAHVGGPAAALRHAFRVRHHAIPTGAR